MAIYELRSNVLIEEYGTNYEQHVVDSYGIDGLSFTQKNELKNAIKEYDNQLVQDLDNSVLREVVLSIEVGIDDKEAVTRVGTKRALNENEIKELEYYLEVQYSDGWGEGFEQKAFSEFDGEAEIYDEEEDEYYTEDETYELYASFWNDKNFEIRTVKVG